jgi:hypothetical protein
MTTRITSRHARFLALLALAAGIALALAFQGQARAETEAAATQRQVIGTAASNRFRGQLRFRPTAAQPPRHFRQ